MRSSSAPGQWRPRILPRGTILVTTRSGLSTALSGLGTTSDEEKEDLEYQLPELATLTAHADGDPPQAIVVTPGDKSYSKPWLLVSMS